MAGNVLDEQPIAILSPAQLAAVLHSGSLDPHQKLVNRVWGGVALFGTALQLAAGTAMVLAPEPTMASKVGGSVLLIHGADSGQAAVRQMWTGEYTKDFTQVSAEKAARALGASDRVAYWAGVGVDIVVPVSVSLLVGAERVFFIRAGRISLAAEETAGGHTLLKHVNQSEAALRARLIAEPGIPAATSWSSIRVAEDVISDTLRSQKFTVENWAKAGGKSKLVLKHLGSSPIGAGIRRSGGKLEAMSNAIIVLRRAQIAGRVYFVLTSYPVP